MNDSMLDAFARKGGSSEARHVAENELLFRVEARRNKKLAVWAASVLGFDADHVPVYLDEIIAEDLKAPGAETVVAKLKRDLAAKGVEVSESELRTRINDFELEARREFHNDGY